jgi:ATP-dependent helicase/nuclease subunit A
MLLAQNHLTEKQAESIDIDKLSDILNNKFFERVLSSGHVYREERFTVEISPALIDDSFSDITQNVGCIMQGAVDLAFEENGKLVIVDYKTDFVKNASELIERYKKQLELYKEALTQTLSKEVEELYIFSICLNEVIKV